MPTTTQTAQPDYVALAMVLALAVIEAIQVVPVLETVTAAPAAPGSAGYIKLHNVEPKTAAMLMAIVADKMQKPLTELRFISIKEVE